MEMSDYQQSSSHFAGPPHWGFRPMRRSYTQYTEPPYYIKGRIHFFHKSKYQNPKTFYQHPKAFYQKSEPRSDHFYKHRCQLPIMNFKENISMFNINKNNHNPVTPYNSPEKTEEMHKDPRITIGHRRLSCGLDVEKDENQDKRLNAKENKNQAKESDTEKTKSQNKSCNKQANRKKFPHLDSRSVPLKSSTKTVQPLGGDLRQAKTYKEYKEIKKKLENKILTHRINKDKNVSINKAAKVTNQKKPKPNKLKLTSKLTKKQQEDKDSPLLQLFRRASFSKIKPFLTPTEFSTVPAILEKATESQVIDGLKMAAVTEKQCIVVPSIADLAPRCDEEILKLVESRGKLETSLEIKREATFSETSTDYPIEEGEKNDLITTEPVPKKKRKIENLVIDLTTEEYTKDTRSLNTSDTIKNETEESPPLVDVEINATTMCNFSVPLSNNQNAVVEILCDDIDIQDDQNSAKKTKNQDDCNNSTPKSHTNGVTTNQHSPTINYTNQCHNNIFAKITSTNSVGDKTPNFENNHNNMYCSLSKTNPSHIDENSVNNFNGTSSNQKMTKNSVNSVEHRFKVPSSNNTNKLFTYRSNSSQNQTINAFSNVNMIKLKTNLSNNIQNTGSNQLMAKECTTRSLNNQVRFEKMTSSSNNIPKMGNNPFSVCLPNQIMTKECTTNSSNNQVRITKESMTSVPNSIPITRNNQFTGIPSQMMSKKSPNVTVVHTNGISWMPPAFSVCSNQVPANLSCYNQLFKMPPSYHHLLQNSVLTDQDFFRECSKIVLFSYYKHEERLKNVIEFRSNHPGLIELALGINSMENANMKLILRHLANKLADLVSRIQSFNSVPIFLCGVLKEMSLCDRVPSHMTPGKLLKYFLYLIDLAKERYELSPIAKKFRDVLSKCYEKLVWDRNIVIIKKQIHLYLDLVRKTRNAINNQNRDCQNRNQMGNLEHFGGAGRSQHSLNHHYFHDTLSPMSNMIYDLPNAMARTSQSSTAPTPTLTTLSNSIAQTSNITSQIPVNTSSTTQSEPISQTSNTPRIEDEMPNLTVGYPASSSDTSSIEDDVSKNAQHEYDDTIELVIDEQPLFELIDLTDESDVIDDQCFFKVETKMEETEGEEKSNSGSEDTEESDEIEPAEEGSVNKQVKVEVTDFSKLKCFCGSVAKNVCVCKIAFYCGLDCQVEDWTTHQKFCVTDDSITN